MSQRKRSLSSADSRKQIDEYIALSVDTAIGEMLGEAVVDAFYVYMNERGVARREVRQKVKLFCSILDNTFGIQSQPMQRKIAQKLFSRLGLAFTPIRETTLVDYVATAEEMLRHVEA